MSGSKLPGLFKHKSWVSVGTVAGILALGLWGFGQFESNRSSGEDLSLAAVTLGELSVVDAVSVSPNGESSEPTKDVATKPIDITFKNNGKSVASIESVSVKLIRGAMIGSCYTPGAGGVGVAADYTLQIPPDQIVDDTASKKPVSRNIDFKVGPGETERLAVTVGPVQQAENTAVIMAVRLGFRLTDGRTLETEPVVIGATPAIIDALTSQYPDPRRSDGTWIEECRRSAIQQIDQVTSSVGLVAEPVKQLRNAYQKAP